MPGKHSRNGEIGLLSFILVIGIVVYHFQQKYSASRFFCNGYIVIEFLFVLSGFLMARCIHQILSEKARIDIPNTTWKIVLRTAGSFYWFYFAAILIQLLVKNVIFEHIRPLAFARDLFKSIPTFTLTFYGLNWSDTTLYVGNTWFFSAMLLCFFILIPILLYRFDLSVKVIFPILFILIMGYLMHRHKMSLHKIDAWDDLFYSGIPRAFAEIALGASCFYLPEWINKKRLTAFRSVFVADLVFSVFKWLCIILLLLYSFGAIDGKEDLYSLIICPILICISYSNVRGKIHENPFIDYLRDLSLPLFIFHKVILNVLLLILPNQDLPDSLFVLLVAVTLAISIIFKHLVCYFIQLFKKYLSPKIFKSNQA